MLREPVSGVGMVTGDASLMPLVMPDDNTVRQRIELVLLAEVSTQFCKAMISTSNDGLKRIAYGDQKTDKALYSLYKNEIEELRKEVKSGIIASVDYSFELEKLQVELAIKDFSNLGFWEVDGRV